MSFRKESGTMNLASEKVWKTKERVRGMGGGIEERKAFLWRSFFIRCRVLSGPEIIGILATLPQLFSVTGERENFLARGCLLEKRCWISDSNSSTEVATVQLYLWQTALRSSYIPESQFVMHKYLHTSGNYVYRIK
jgi:hypothetical protein